MTYQSADAYNRIIVTSPTITDAQEVTGESQSSTSRLNTDFIKNVGDSLAGQGTQQRKAIDTMQSMSKSGISAFNQASGNVSNMTNAMSNATYDGTKESISNALSVAGSDLRAAKDSIGNFGSIINPNSGGLPGLTALAKFLACPEPSFLQDLLNATGMIINKLLNSKPVQLLTTAMTNLTKSILTSIPGTNYLLDFFTGVGNYLNTFGSDVKYVLSLITGVLKGLGRNTDYLTGNNMLSSLSSMLDPSQGSYNINGSSTGFRLPTALNNANCSQMGKIINQLQGSYRSNNRFDDLSSNSSYLYSISDPAIRRTADGITGSSILLGNRNQASKLHTSNGYTSNTALSNSISTAIEVNRVLSSMETEYNSVGDDPARFEAVRINTQTNGQYLNSLMNTSSSDLIAFNEGLGNINRRSSFYDLGGILS